MLLLGYLLVLFKISTFNYVRAATITQLIIGRCLSYSPVTASTNVEVIHQPNFIESYSKPFSYSKITMYHRQSFCRFRGLNILTDGRKPTDAESIRNHWRFVCKLRQKVVENQYKMVYYSTYYVLVNRRKHMSGTRRDDHGSYHG